MAAKKVVAKKPAAKKAAAEKPSAASMKQANAKARGTYEKNHAAWKKNLDRQLAAVKGTPAQKAKQRASIKAAMAAKKPAKPSMAGELAQEYKWSHALLMSDPELKKLFAQAVKGQWSEDRFAAQVQSTGWYQNNSQSWRDSETLRLTDPASWKQEVDQRKATFKNVAIEYGANLDEGELNQLADLAARGDWNEQQIKHWVAARLDLTENGGLFGLAGKAEDELKSLASANGINMAADWYKDKATSILLDEKDIEEYKDMIREQAAQTYGGWADRIRAGENVRDLANPYVQSMSRVLEIPDTEVSLMDPTLRKAITNSTTTGEPAVSPLWQFEKDLRSDTRWKSTKNAQATAADSGMDILKQWGLMK